MVETPPGGWLANEKNKPHHDTDGWCRCCCDECAPIGCSHRSNPAGCVAHPLQNPGRNLRPVTTTERHSIMVTAAQISATFGNPSTPVAPPAVDVPLDPGAELANPAAYNGEVREAEHETVPTVGTDEPTAEDDESRKAQRTKAITKAYTDTAAWLREKYRDEYNAHQKALLAEQGVDWAPALTPAEKAAKQIRDLMAEHQLSIDDFNDE